MTNVIITGLASALSYLACALFFQSGARRSTIELLKTSERAQTGARIAGWALLVLALFLFSAPQGWERGVTIWIGAVAFAGGVSLLVSALRPNWHAYSGLAAGACAVLLTGALIVQGVSG
ncbi:MAG: DUF3325 family protein [Pseudomonadota bacterium]